RFANVTIPYSSQSQIKDIHARTIAPDGKITVLKSNAVFDINLYPEFIFYSDVRARTFTLPAVDEGSIIEYTYTRDIRNLTYWNNWIFQHDVPTQISRYSLTIPRNWEYHSQMYHIDIPPQREEIEANTVRYTWEARDIPNYILEPTMPPLAERLKRIEFAPPFVKDWQGISKWYFNLATLRMQPDPAIRQFTEQMLQPISEPREKLKQIFNFVQNKIRYVAISVGIGSYQPHFASETFQNRYGDCKDMATLIVAMAQVADIKAWPVLVSTAYNGQVDTTLYSQAQFNHAIACAQLPDSTFIWMDATDKDVPFGSLPWYDQDQLVFVVTAEGKGRFQKTPLLAAADNLTRRECQLRLDANGKLQGQIRWTYRGAVEQVQRRLLRNLEPALKKQWLASMLVEMVPSAGLDSFMIHNLSQLENPLQIETYFQAPNFVIQNGRHFVLDATIFRHSQYESFFPLQIRQHPIRLRFLEKIEDLIQLTLPDQMEMLYLPKSQRFTSDFGEYELKFNLSGSLLKIQRQFKTTQPQIITLDYSKWLNFLKDVSNSDRDRILLVVK
ncbi:DUF3857 and transglutaminase domain-containing protein, partial [candidate division KSB1 bacterium]|nr:DUF3857 and transglutaminase domain-containing protein [candidate division KSB1 bacterium]